jgi:penicillin amidase
MPIPDAFTPTPAPLREPLPHSRKRRWLRILCWTVVCLAAVSLLAVGGSLLWLRSAAKAALPVLDGEMHLTGLTAPVTVQRDAHGVPHIQAATQEDLFVAQGYVTAQDRLWQLDVLRRNSNGELAEILGSSLLAHDKTQRVLRIHVTAQRIYSSLPAADRARLDAYARGVNLFIEQHQDALPAEFKLLFYKPRPWSGEDSISIGLMMEQTLDTHFENKLGRERVSALLHNSKLESDLYPVGSWRDHPPTGILLDLSQPHAEPAPSTTDEEDEENDFSRASTGSSEDLAALRTLLSLPSCQGCAAGSNNWVIAGRHTASGKPLLSNDMHLELSVPNIWYMADLEAPGYHAAGVTLPGMPFVIAGHNEHVAWGITALYGDVQDIYVEKLDGKGNYLAVDGSWKPLSVDHEVIHVRGGKDVPLELHSTAHGPLLNPIFARESRPITLRWTLYDPTLNSLPLYQLNVASNWTEFSAALNDWNWPTQNVVYSDDQGHIAYQAVGRLPLRPAGLQGVPIHDTAHEWQGYIPFDQMPSSVDPPSGFLATANSRVTTASSPYPISLEWADPYRAERIYKALQGREQLKPQDLLAVQNDVYSEVDQELGHRFAYAIDHASKVDAQMRKAADLMRSWDGRLTTDSAAASVVTQARRALWKLILEPKLGKEISSYYWTESDFAEEEIIMHNSLNWLPSNYKSWDDLLAEAVRRGLKNGKSPSDPAHWTYGSWHTVDLEHPLSKFLPAFLRIAGTGPQPQSGDTTTVKQVGRDFGPSQRFTMDWSNIDGSTENIVLGESGNPLSPYFSDQWKDWCGGTTFALPFTSASVASQTSHTLRLLP